MTIFDYNRPRNGLFYSFLKIEKGLRTSSLIVIMIGVFLLPKTAYLSTITPEKIIEITNKERNKAEISTLTTNPLLEKAAKDKAEAILASQTFDHQIAERRFSAWIKDSGYKYSIVGENLAIDFVTSEGVFKAWLNSPDHKKNILNPEYEEIGVAVVEGKFEGQNTIIVAQIFGSPEKIDEEPNLNLSIEEATDKNKHQDDFSTWLAKKLIATTFDLPLLSLGNNDSSKKISLASIKKLKLFF